MPSLAAIFRDIKTAIGGNRESTEFEMSFGQPMEERLHITPVTRAQRRVLSQLEFALAMNKQLGGKYDAEIRNALDFLRARLDETGTVSNADALEAEQDLLPLERDAKAYKLILCAHAHIDMNWMWSWQETVASTLDTFRTMLAIMREYPQFTYSQSQASVYRIVEDFEPEMMREIKERISEGRWEVTATSWVETDKNMPSTESLARHILYTKRYMRDTWGVDPASLSIDFSPDTFGHSAYIPQIDNAGGVQYLYHCRANDVAVPLYRWRAPAGGELLVYKEPYWYNSGIRPHIGAGLPELAHRCGGLKTGLIVYGVGNHGGGPTRRDVEAALEMQGWPVYPKVTFGTFGQFFAEAEAVREALPLIEGEQNFIFPGCYTTQSRIKMGNRHGEDALYCAEALSALTEAVTDAPYSRGQFEKAWRDVLFTHFHDILTGSCVRDTREHAMGLYSEALAIANTQRSRAMRALAERIDTSPLYAEEDRSASQSEGAGAGYGIEGFSPPAAERGSGIRRVYHIFNPSARARKGVAELTVWDWPGDLRRLRFSDAEGNSLEAQPLHKEPEKYWDHMFFKVLVEAEVPAMGYATVLLDEAEIDDYPLYYHPAERTEKPYDNYMLENEYLSAEFCFRTGLLLSLVDKESGQEMIDLPAGFKLVTCDGNGDSAWVIGRYMSERMLDSDVVVKPVERSGALRGGISIEARAMSSTIRAHITLDKGSRALRYDATVDWHEFSRPGEPVPTLVFAAPVAYDAREYLYDVPGGSVARGAMHIDVPALTYGAAVNGEGPSLAIATDCKYGLRGAEDTIAATLIHSANSPDPYPERGIHRIQLYLFAQRAHPAALRETAFDALHPFNYISAAFGGGDLPMTGSLLTMGEGTTATLSGVKPAEDGPGVVVRLYETAGEDTVAAMTFTAPIASAKPVDIMEQECGGGAVVEGSTVRLELPARSIAAVKITFK